MVDNTLYADGLSFPAPTLLAGDSGSALTAPIPTLSSGIWAALLTAPIPTMSGDFGNRSDLSVPIPALDAAMPIESPYITAELLRIPAPELIASGIAGGVLTVVEYAPLPLLDAVLVNPTVITSGLTAPAPLLEATGHAGNTLTAALSAIAPTLVASGYPAFTITAGLVAPAPWMSATLVAPIAGSRTWVLNTRKGALSEYGPEFNFNSYAHFNRQVLACGPSGIVVLGAQDLDNAAAITARVRTGNEGFESSYHKRVPRIYASGEFAGDMLFRTITENSTRTYSLPANGITRVQQRRIPVGKGPKSRHWSFEVENVGGADFSINDVLVYPTKLRRRVQ